MTDKKEIIIGGKKYVAEDEPGDVRQKSEPEAMHRLTAPPRRISAGVMMRLVTGGGIANFGWPFICFGMLFLSVYVATSHPADRSEDWRDAGTATLISSEKPRGKQAKENPDMAVENHSAVLFPAVIGMFASQPMGSRGHGGGGTPVYRHVFEKTSDGRTVVGRCYSSWSMADRVGQQVNVETSEKYGVYRIKGTLVGRHRGGDPGIYIVFIFPLFGLPLVLYFLVSGLQTAWFLRNGAAAKGMVMKIQETSSVAGGREVMKLTYEFTAEDGETRTTTYRTEETKAVKDELWKVLFYDPRKPTRILPLDALPDAVTVDERDGFFRLTEDAKFSTFWTSALYLAFAAVFVLEWGVFMRWWPFFGF